MNTHTPPFKPGVHQALTGLVQRISDLRFPLAIDSADAGRKLQKSLGNQLTDYVIPRVQETDAPLLVVVGGSTGAGKSTLVNSILDAEISTAGVLRPTTRWPVVVFNPADREHFSTDRILPGLARVTRKETDINKPQLRLAESDAVPQGIALLDSPDIDSVMDDNRVLARQLLAAADLWVFVTTAARYADAVPWEQLKQSVERGTAVAMVLDRVPPAANQEVRHHLTSLLKQAGLGSSPVFTIPELELEDNRLPAAAVFPLRSWLLNLANNERAREAVVNRTLYGALRAVPANARTLAEYADAQDHGYAALQKTVDDEFTRARQALGESLVSGQVLRGEVLARWQDFVGTGQFFRGLEPTVARIRDRITSAVTGKRDAAEPLSAAIESSVAILVREQALGAVNGVVYGWQNQPAGVALLKDNPQLGGLPPDFDKRVNRLIANWSDGVNNLVREVGQSKRAKARVLSFGVNGVGAVLMLAVFAGTGGLTGAEAGIAGGTAIVAGKLLDTIFGDQVTRDLAQTARKNLLEETGALVTAYREPFDQVLADVHVPIKQGRALANVASRLEENL